MFPILLDLHFFKIYTFGVFAAAAFAWALFVLWKHIKLTSYQEENIFDAIFGSMAGGLLLSRIVYVAFHWNDFGFNILKIILVNGYPGASLIGFFVGFYITLFILLKRFGIEPKKGFDYTAVPMLVALSLGKVGSFLSGVDVGTKTSIPLSVIYAGYKGLRHITAFYEALLFLVGAYVAHKMLFAMRRQNLPQGSVFVWLVFVFGAVCLLLDKIKSNHLYLGSLRVNEVVGLAFFIVGIIYFIFINRQKIITSASSAFKKVTTKKHHESTIHKGGAKSGSDTADHKEKNA